ncbi:MAG: site-specific integrase [Armatimonadetes bacterium]|nr:site-specific integrase [Armatimonadota bacterium]
MGCIRKRGRGYEWRIHTPDGREVSKAGFRLKKDAQDALAKAVAAMADQRFVRPDRLTVAEYLTGTWLPAVKPTIAHTSYINYEGVVHNHIAVHIGDIPLQKLTPGHVKTMYAELSQSGHHKSTKKEPKGLSPKSIRNVHTTLHRALNDAVEWGHVATNVATRVKPPKLNGEHHMTAWTVAQLQTFLARTGEDRLYPLWRLVAMTGVRRGEAMGLRWSDVDLENNRISIVQARSIWGTSSPKTPRSRRSLDLDPETAAVLRRWRRQQLEERLLWGEHWTDTGLVFTREDGKGYHPDTITGDFFRLQGEINRQLAEEAEKKGEKPVLLPRVRLHDLRHTHATLLLATDVNPKVISERLGHASVAFTLSVYAHVLPGIQKEAISRLAAVIDG